MQPWIVDAHDFHFDDHQDLKWAEQSLHRTRNIDEFLIGRDRSEIVVAGPKGTGKTLLLQLKRLYLLQQRPGCKLLPQGSLVDKSASPSPQLNKKKIEHIARHTLFWRTLWTAAFMASLARSHQVLSNSGSNSKTAFKSATIRKVFDGISPPSAIDIFSDLLAVSHEQYHSIEQDVRLLTPHLRPIHSPIYMFIDNIDEFFSSHLSSDDDSQSAFGVTRADYWYNSQIGALQAARQINHVVKHLRVYCSVRTEALERAVGADEMATQYRSSWLELEYSRSDLVSILEKNIAAEPESNLIETKANSLFGRWVGRSSEFLDHPTTGESEHIADYIIRHTLMRPRDVVAIGREISRIRPNERSVTQIKSTVNRAAAGLVRDYIQECKPHLLGFDFDLLVQSLAANCMNTTTIQKVRERYIERYIDKHCEELQEAEGILDTMHRIGLLGTVGREQATPNTETQIFLNPAERRFLTRTNLPEADTYLIHPALSDLIASNQRTEYMHRRNRINIIGSGRIWRTEADGHFVISGDIQGYTVHFMNSEHYNKNANELAAQYLKLTQTIGYRTALAGDGFHIADKNIHALSKLLRDLQHALDKISPGSKFRFGGDFGVVSLPPDNGAVIATGQAFRTSARVQAISEAGKLLVTSAFFEQASRLLDGKIAHIQPQEINIAKQSEAPELRRLFAIPFYGAI